MLESAISKQRTIKFRYRSLSRDEVRERTIDPYALLLDRGRWYVIGRDHDRGAERTFRVSRIQGDLRLATRRERDFRLPAEFDIEAFRGRPDWQATRLGGSSACTGAPGASRTARSSRSMRASRHSPAGSCGRTDGPCRSRRRSFVDS